MKLIYVFDAYCGWSLGFSGTLREVLARHPELPVDVISGGLFTGERRVPMRGFAHIGSANAEIGRQTGARFGEPYRRLAAEGSFVMDSEAAARGLAALRHGAPDRAAEFAVALQRAFFHDGRSLSAPGTYRELAHAAGLDADRVVASFEGPAARAEAEADFARAAALGVGGFPTLLAIDGPRTVTLARGCATPDEVDRRLASLGVTHAS
ncbi:DsbA family protein [Streptomyces sp. MBT49]|uniref:DsbA family protein n=1 Tax=Streptomyces sp. MBT49 TaxID=1488380 RepID=UPI00190A5D76|nr:DsbA family protein [Streptomyces sp. MBT49]MBK3624185.1 DsbA family protein [Streptomyces sp. MBT49]